jgi:hypothetical protein
MFREWQSDRTGGLRSARLHLLVSVHHFGDARFSLPGRDLCSGSDASCRSSIAGGSTIDLSIASSHHSRSASFARVLALATTSQCHPDPWLVLVAALSSEPSQPLSYPASSREAMTPSHLSLLHSREKYRYFSLYFRTHCMAVLSERSIL